MQSDQDYKDGYEDGFHDGQTELFVVMDTYNTGRGVLMGIFDSFDKAEEFKKNHYHKCYLNISRWTLNKGV